MNSAAWSGWSLTLYYPMRNAGQMTIEKTHPRLILIFLPGISTYQLQFNTINVFSNYFVKIWNKTSRCIDQMK